MGGKISSLVVIEGGNKDVAHDVAMQAAAMRPLYTTIDAVPEEDVEHENQLLKNK